MSLKLTTITDQSYLFEWCECVWFLYRMIFQRLSACVSTFVAYLQSFQSSMNLQIVCQLVVPDIIDAPGDIFQFFPLSNVLFPVVLSHHVFTFEKTDPINTKRFSLETLLYFLLRKYNKISCSLPFQSLNASVGLSFLPSISVTSQHCERLWTETLTKRHYKNVSPCPLCLVFYRATADRKQIRFLLSAAVY